jgi:5-methylcytosine-specific restriction protein B
MRRLMPIVTQDEVRTVLATRRFVILEGPPGTGKTRMAELLLAGPYQGCGKIIQFHPNTTYGIFWLNGRSSYCSRSQDVLAA